MIIPGSVSLSNNMDVIRWDVLIGDLSYPMYLCHWLFAITLLGVWPRITFHSYDLQKIFAALSALCFAILLEFAVARPVDRYRKKIRERAVPIDDITGNPEPNDPERSIAVGS